MSILLHSSWCRVNSGPNWLTIHKTFLREKRGTAKWLFPGGKLRSLWALSAPWDGLSCHIQRPGSVCGPQLPHQRPRQWQAGHPGRLPKGSPTCCKGSLEGTCPQATWRLLAVEDTEIKGVWSWGGIAHGALVGLPLQLHLVMEVGLLGRIGTWGWARAAGQHVPSLWTLEAAGPQL